MKSIVSYGIRRWEYQKKSGEYVPTVVEVGKRDSALDRYEHEEITSDTPLIELVRIVKNPFTEFVYNEEVLQFKD